MSDPAVSHTFVTEAELVGPETPEPAPVAALVPYRAPEHQAAATIPPRDEMQALAQLATTLSAAQALPVALRDKPNDVFLVLLSARDLGTSLTVALREFHVIEGKVTLSPKVKMAMVNERGREQGWAIWPDADNGPDSATWYATRADRPGVQFHSTFTWEDAQRAGMVRWECEATNHTDACKAAQRRRERHDWCKNNWASYPQRMVSWRALGYLMDDVFPEVGTGLYSPDELGAVTDEDGNPVIDVTEVEPLAGHKGPRGRRNRNAPPTPAETPVADDVRAALIARGQAIATVAEAKAALTALWHNEDGTWALPPVTNEAFMVSHVKGAEARLAAIEKRLAAGEWGPWDGGESESATTQPEGGQTGAEPAAGTEDSAESLQGHTAAVSQEVGVGQLPKGASTPWGDDAQLAEAVRAEVEQMDPVDVLAALVARELQATGRPKDHKAQLAAVLYAERGGKPMATGLTPEQEVRIAEMRAQVKGVAPGVLDAAHQLVHGYSDEDVVAEATDRGLDTSVGLAILRVVLAESIAADEVPGADPVVPE